MTPGPASLLALMQQSDSAFPSGAVSFSSGLETLVHDGLMTAGNFEGFVVDVMRHRWNPFDRHFLARSHQAVDVEATVALDHEFEASVFGDTARSASRRAGSALLGTWARLDVHQAADYRRRIRMGETEGHLPIVQGLVFSSTGLELGSAEAAACWTTVSGLASAAVRLGIVGHLSAQRTLLTVRPILAALLAVPVDDEALPSSWSPLQDIAQARHASADLRLFAS